MSFRARVMDGLQPGATGLVTLQPDLHPQHVAPLALVDLAASCVSREIRCELWEQACRKRKASVTGMMRFRDRRRKAYSCCIAELIRCFAYAVVV